MLRNSVGPQTYSKQGTTPANSQKFGTALRRFKFNEHVEAVDSKSYKSWRNLQLTGMMGKPSPGPGEYRYPSEFGQYISEKFI
jgi:hypothetical protein